MQGIDAFYEKQSEIQRKSTREEANAETRMPSLAQEDIYWVS